MTAIERIQGFACEVTQEQWEELVRVADKVGVKVFDELWPNKVTKLFISLYEDGDLVKDSFIVGKKTEIPYPDFISKLKGEEKWEPKNGEEVEVRPDSNYVWGKAIFIGMDVEGKHVVRVNRIGQTPYVDVPPHNIRKPIETITRQEAEAILNKRIID